MFKTMVRIHDEDYIGEGEIRTCYVHTNDANLCIKIPKPHVTRAYISKEILYFLKIAKRNTNRYQYPFYSSYKGEEETNLGLGQVFELIRDETTGKISKTLEFYLKNTGLIQDNVLENALYALKQHMIKFKVFTRDLRARNLCCKLLKDGTVQLIIIDGIGHRDFFPLADWFLFFSKKKIERTYKKWRFTSIEEQRNFLRKTSVN